MITVNQTPKKTATATQVKGFLNPSASTTSLGTSSTGALPKVDLTSAWNEKQQQVNRDNAVRTKQAVDTAKEQAYYAGANPGTKDYQSFLTRSQASADNANLQAKADLQDFGLNLANQQRQNDREDFNMMVDTVGDDANARRKLVSAFLNGGAANSDGSSDTSVNDVYASLVNSDGSINGAKTDYAKAVESEMEYLTPESQTPGSKYFGKTEAQLREIAANRVSYLHDDQYRDQNNEKNLTDSIDAVSGALESNDFKGVTGGQIHTAIKSDDTGMIRDRISQMAVPTPDESDKDKAFHKAAITAGVGGFVSDSNGAIYRVEALLTDDPGAYGTQSYSEDKGVILYDVDTGRRISKTY